MENYYKDQLGKLVLDKTYAPQIKITSLNTETKWLELNEESASEIRNWLDKNYPTKEREAPLKQRIILKMYELSEEELVQLNNLIASEFEWTNDGIYLNNLEFFNTFYPDDSSETRVKHHVKHRKWIKFASNGYLESFPEMTVDKLTQIAGDIPTYIENNFEQFKDLLKL